MSKAAVRTREIEIIDYRLRPSAQSLLGALLKKEPELQIWAEYAQPDDLPSQPRQDLCPAETLVIWTSPPTRAVLNSILRRVTPQKVILLGHDPALSNWQQLAKYIAGLAKFVIAHREGITSLTEMAAACAMDTEVVRAALHYWVNQGAFNLTIQDDSVQFSSPNLENTNPESTEIYKNILINLLGEIKAYRHFFATAAPENLNFSNR
jgi:hypothetical protein